LHYNQLHIIFYYNSLFHYYANNELFIITIFWISISYSMYFIFYPYMIGVFLYMMIIVNNVYYINFILYLLLLIFL